MADNHPVPKRGDVIQLSPAHRWAGSLWIIDDVRAWGVIASHQPLGGPAVGVAYARLTTEQFAVIGPAAWLPEKSAPGGST